MTTAIKPIEEVKNTLVKMDDSFKAALPTSIASDRFRQTVVMAVQSDPKLLAANRRSLYISCMKAATDGLLLDSREAALVIFKNTVQYMPMAAGIVKKILSTGKYKTVQAEVVCENDEFDSWIDEHGPHWKHRKARTNRGKPILAYAYAITKDNGTAYEEMNADEIGAVRKVAKTKMVWDGDFGNEMWRKSPLRRLAKKLLTSSDIANLFAHDNENYSLEQSEQGESETPAVTAEVSDHSTAASRAIAEAEEPEEPEMAEEMF